MSMRVGLAMLGILSAAALASPASAAVCQKGTTSWKNPNGGAWKTEANWSNGLPSKACVAKITIAGDFGVAVGTVPGAGGVAKGLILGGPSGSQNVVVDNSSCGARDCAAFDSRLVVGRGGIKINENGAMKLIAGKVASTGPIRMTGGRLYGGGAITARRGISNLGGLLVLDGNGVISVEGAYMQDDRATMAIGVPAEGTPDLPGGLTVSGLMRLDGRLRVEGPAPTRTAPFPVLKAGFGLFGTFSGTTYDDQEYSTTYAIDGMTLGPAAAEPDDTDPELEDVRMQPTSFAKSALLGLRTTEAGKVDVLIERIRPAQAVAARVVPAESGANTYRLDAKKLGLEPGRHRLTLRIIDTAGNRSDAETLVFTIRRP
jgi:hypothetical protein